MSMFSMTKIILSSLFRKSATVDYPLKPRLPVPRARGRVEIDIEACIFCGICARKCPTAAITVTREEKHWAIKPFQCILCGCCTENCPKQCLRMENTPTPVQNTKEMVRDARISADSPDH